MNDIAVSTKGISRDFGHLRAVDDCSLSVQRGRILALAGPNGAGKTTLLKLLTGLIAPTRGEAVVLGEPCFPPSEANAGRIACVLDTVEPPGGARIRHLLRLRAGAVEQFDWPRARALLEQKQLPLGKTWRTLSKGQKRWVLAVLALAGGAELLILDEPADGLDPSARRQLYGLIRDEVNQRGTTVVLASHILADVERVADEILIIDRGRTLLHASLEDLREQVREVEFSEPIPPEAIPGGVQLISQGPSGGSTLAWIRIVDVSAAEAFLPGELRRRTVGLETLYLALTEGQVAASSTSADGPAVAVADERGS